VLFLSPCIIYWTVVLSRCIISIDSVKLIGKLQDGTVFLKKGHDDDQPFEFRIDEGTISNGFKF
jgi:hypothetical protein